MLEVNNLLIFLWIQAAFAATAFWEAYGEGKNVGASDQCGWVLKIRRFKLTAYHFWTVFVAYPLLVFLPLAVVGFSWHLFGLLLSAYATGWIIEDFLWFVVNPRYPFKKWNPKETTWYPWVTIGRFSLPLFYYIGFLIAFSSWLFLWR